jgi:outer membrane protein TolC
MNRIWRLTLAPTAIALLAGCASLGIDEALDTTNRDLRAFTGGELTLARDAVEHARRQALSQQLLAQPLSQHDAVQLALANSPAVQALLAERWADLATARQAGRLPNPVFSFERMRLGSELELGRLLSFGLIDLVLLPQRATQAAAQAQLARIQLGSDVVDQVTQVRQAWVRAVAAQQALQYAAQVQQSAEASAELARRMQRVGNFSRLQRARQQVFYADATSRLAIAQQGAVATREALVRALGLDNAQAAALRLPERLPDLPAAPRTPQDVTAAASDQRLDLQLARAQLDQAGRAQGIGRIASFVDVEAGVRRDTVFDAADGSRGTRRGFELDIRLPLFDWGGARRDALGAQALAAAHRYDATARNAASQLREGYAAYRTAWDLARHARDELVPLHQTIADENLLRYNGMLIGVFELLAEARGQVASVTRAIEAQQQFWLADAALTAQLIGRPAGAANPLPAASAPAAAAAAH